MKRVAIVNTGLSNLHSISRAVEECGSDPLITDNPTDLRTAASIILPGVGSFPRAMARLRETGLAEELSEQVVGLRIPILGICLGMQLLATTGFEGEASPGLGWIEGIVARLEPGPGERIPHVGWNDVKVRRPAAIFAGLDSTQNFYFVHSFSLRPANESDVIATTEYAGGFTAAVQRDHIIGVQFHPEKSQQAGLAVLRNFLAA
jgi:glutamine amidotransferase